MTTDDQPALRVAEQGVSLLRDPRRNKGAGFTTEERDALGLRGLLPVEYSDIEGRVSP